MVNFIIKKDVYDFKRTKNNESRIQIGKKTGILGIILNIFLFTIKLISGLISNSVAIISDAFNNISDAGSSVLTLVGFRLASKKPDSNHPYGHGRMEYISGLTVAFIVILMGAEVLRSSVKKLFAPTEINFSGFTMIILLLSVIIKIYMWAYNRKYGKMIDSTAMTAASADSFCDAVSTTAVLFSTIICHFTKIRYIDAICGICVSVFILFSGIMAVKETISPLLGKAPDEDFIKKVKEIAGSSDKISGIHDLIVHDYGPGRIFVSLHCEVSEDEKLREIHKTIDELENKLSSELKCNAIIHIDPVTKDSPEIQNIRSTIENVIKSTKSDIIYHDLQIEKNGEISEIIFDLVLPYNCKTDSESIKTSFAGAIESIDKNYKCKITIDTDYDIQKALNNPKGENNEH